MAAQYETGPVTQWTAWNANVIPFDAFGVAINYFLNRTPMWTRLPKGPVGSPTFYITNDNYRPRTQRMSTTVLNTADTTVVMIDGSTYDLGDVIRIDSEDCLVTSVAANTVTITRAYANTTVATHNANSVVQLITNTRTGAEVNANSVSRVPATVVQYCQTVQHAYSIGGALEADTNWVGGFASPLQRDKLLAMQHVVDDFESAIYYGDGVPLAAAGTRPAMLGLKNLIVSNKTTSPTNSAAYKPSDLVRDTIQAVFNGGGNPTTMFVSTDFLGGLATWGHAAMRLNAGANAYGTPIDMFEAPFLSGITIIPAPLLLSGTAICISGTEARVRLKRPMIDKPRGSRGDATEGDIIMEGAIELDNEAHHAWVSGITAFAAA
jgi:hypothetical protein